MFVPRRVIDIIYKNGPLKIVKSGVIPNPHLQLEISMNFLYCEYSVKPLPSLDDFDSIYKIII